MTFDRTKLLLRQEKGSVTIEAAIVFPIIMLSTCVLLMFGMMMYMKVLAIHAAANASERSTVVWNNSHKEPSSGEVASNQYDNLYWRALQDQMLDQLFGGSARNEMHKIHLPAKLGEDAVKLVERKLSLGASSVYLPMEGEISYENRLFERTVKAEVRHPSRSTMLEKMTGVRMQVEGEAMGVITEPVEFIRTVELVRYMSVKLQEMSKLGATPASAGKVLMKEFQP